jgi:potassium-transporting ATPase KdpC subunit
MFFKHLVTSILALVIFSVITGLIYPLLVTGIAQLAFPERANGSLLKRKGIVVGSELIGQPFSDPKYFWSRLSPTSPFPYNAGASGGSNIGPLNPALLDEVQGRITELKKADSLNTLAIPVDLVTSSGSGLDPHISVAAAMYQVPRVARARGLSEDRVRALVERSTVGRTLAVLGEASVNVLSLNLALDESSTHPGGN